MARRTRGDLQFELDQVENERDEMRAERNQAWALISLAITESCPWCDQGMFEPCVCEMPQVMTEAEVAEALIGFGRHEHDVSAPGRGADGGEYAGTGGEQ